MNKNVNIALARQKGLIVNDDTKDYVIIENLYKYLFVYYLNSKVNIQKYDDEISNSDLDFGIAHPMNIQKGNDLNEFSKWKYIYILNDFFVEKLSATDINKLKNALKTQNLVPTPELNEVIERTYPEIIKNNYTKSGYTDESYNIYYGEFHPGNFVKNNALVIKIFYGKDKTKLSDEEYLLNIKAKKEFLDNIVNRIKSDIQEKMKINVDILVEKIPN